MFVKRAKEQWGVKYIVLTSKHHEGFAMYDSKVSDFNVVKAAGRDILRELSDACKKYDMTMVSIIHRLRLDDDNAIRRITKTRTSGSRNSVHTSMRNASRS